MCFLAQESKAYRGKKKKKKKGKWHKLIKCLSCPYRTRHSRAGQSFPPSRTKAMGQGPHGALRGFPELLGAGLLLRVPLQLPQGNLKSQTQHRNPFFFTICCSARTEEGLRRRRLLFVICLRTLCNPQRQLPHKPAAETTRPTPLSPLCCGTRGSALLAESLLLPRNVLSFELARGGDKHINDQ